MDRFFLFIATALLQIKNRSGGKGSIDFVIADDLIVVPLGKRVESGKTGTILSLPVQKETTR